MLSITNFDDCLNKIENLDNYNEKTIYDKTIIHNSIVPNKLIPFQQLDEDTVVWELNNLTYDDYIELITLNFKLNNSEHGKLVYEAYLKHPKKYYEWFSVEINTIIEKEGLLIIKKRKNEKQQLQKVCLFLEKK